jgi:hypothetical protein
MLVVSSTTTYFGLRVVVISGLNLVKFLGAYLGA